jgi:hypothetical protein
MKIFLLLLCLTLTHAHTPIVLEEGSLDKQTLGKDGMILLYETYPDEWDKIVDFAQDISDVYFFEVNCNLFEDWCANYTLPSLLYSVENSKWEPVALDEDIYDFVFDTFEKRCVLNRVKCNEDELKTIAEFEHESPDTISSAVDELRGRIAEFEATFEDYYQKLQDEFNSKRVEIRDSIEKTEEVINILNDLR